MSTNTPTGRDDLLDRVTAVLVENGVGDLSLRRVATAAGTSHRMLIYHFGSREGLLSAVSEQLWQTQQRQMEELADATSNDPRSGAWTYWTRVADQSALAPLVFELSAQAMHGAPWQHVFIESHRHMVEDLAARLDSAGHLRTGSLTTSRMCVALMLGALWELRLTGDREAADATVRAFIDSTWPPP